MLRPRWGRGALCNFLGDTDTDQGTERPRTERPHTDTDTDQGTERPRTDTHPRGNDAARLKVHMSRKPAYH